MSSVAATVVAAAAAAAAATGESSGREQGSTPPHRASMRIGSRLSLQAPESEGSVISKGGSLQRRASFQAIQFHSGTRHSNTSLISGISATDRRASSIHQPMSLSASAAAALASVGRVTNKNSEDAGFNPTGYPVTASRYYTGFKYSLPAKTAPTSAKHQPKRTDSLSGVVDQQRLQFKSKIRRQWRIGIGAAMVSTTAKRYIKEDEEAKKVAQERSQSLAAAAALAKPMMALRKNTATNIAARSGSSAHSTPSNAGLNLSGNESGSSPSKKNFSDTVRSALFKSRVLNYDEQVEAASKMERDAEQKVENERQELEVRSTMQTTPADTTSRSTLMSSLFSREAPLARLVDMAPSLSERAAKGFVPPTVSEVLASSAKPGGGCEGLSLQAAVEAAVEEAMSSLMKEPAMMSGSSMNANSMARSGSQLSQSSKMRGYGTPRKVLLNSSSSTSVPMAASSSQHQAGQRPAAQHEQPYMEKLKDTLFPAIALALESLLYQAVKQQIAREVETGVDMKLPIPSHIQLKVSEADAQLEAERKEQLEALEREGNSPDPAACLSAQDGGLQDEDPQRLSISSSQAEGAAATTKSRTSHHEEEVEFRPMSTFGAAFEAVDVTPEADGGGDRDKKHRSKVGAAAISVGPRVANRKAASAATTTAAAAQVPTNTKKVVVATHHDEDPLDFTDGGGSAGNNNEISLRQRSFSTRSKSFISVQYVTSQKMGAATPTNLLAQESASAIRSSMRRNSSSAFAADPAPGVNYRNLQKEALARAAASFFESRKTFPSNPIVAMLTASDLADPSTTRGGSNSLSHAVPQPHPHINIHASSITSPTVLSPPTSPTSSSQSQSERDCKAAANSMLGHSTHIHQTRSTGKDQHVGHLLQDGHVFKLNSSEVVSFIGGELRRYSENPAASTNKH